MTVHPRLYTYLYFFSFADVCGDMWEQSAVRMQSVISKMVLGGSSPMTIHVVFPWKTRAANHPERHRPCGLVADVTSQLVLPRA